MGINHLLIRLGIKVYLIEFKVLANSEIGRLKRLHVPELIHMVCLIFSLDTKSVIAPKP